VDEVGISVACDPNSIERPNHPPDDETSRTMIQLFPSTDDKRADSSTADPNTSPGSGAVDQHDEATGVMLRVARESREPGPHRPWVYTNMIVAADGATTVDGLSGELGGDGDRMMFRALRAQADIILVGAGTARAEGYRPPQRYEVAQEFRLDRGQRARPRLALVTRSLDLDAGLAIFEDDAPETRPLIISSQRSWTERGGDLSERAEPIVAGDEDVDLGDALGQLKQRGFDRVLCEGGPSLNGRLVAADLIDEWNLTIAPLLAGGESTRAAVGPMPGGPPPGMRLDRVWLREEYLFCRWIRRDRSRPGESTTSD